MKDPNSVAVNKGLLQIRATHVAICHRRSVGMDAWSSDQLKRMQLGGNDKLNNFLQKYGVSKDTDIKEKYNSTAAEVRLPVRAALASSSPSLLCGLAGVQPTFCLLRANRKYLHFDSLVLFPRLHADCLSPCNSADLQPPGVADLQRQAESRGGGQAVHSASALTSICPEAGRPESLIAAQHHKQQRERRRLG